MSRHNYLANAPIKEAAFGLNFNKAISLDFWNSIVEELKDLFPKKTERKALVFGFNQEPNKVEIDGYYLKNSNNKITLQLLKTGFVLSFSKPYEGWEKSYKCFKEVLKLTTAKNVEVYPKVISLKYVNRMNFSREEFKKSVQLFHAKPNYTSLSGDIFNYQMHVSEKLSKNTISNFITNSRTCGSDEDLIHLDTHISVMREFDQENNDEKIEVEFSELREIKNNIFYNSFDSEILKQYE